MWGWAPPPSAHPAPPTHLLTPKLAHTTTTTHPQALIDLPVGVASVEAWADSMQGGLLASITAARKAAEAAAAEVARQRRAVRLAAQEKAEAVRRKQMRHVLFTTPEVVEVGWGVGGVGWGGV